MVVLNNQKKRESWTRSYSRPRTDNDSIVFKNFCKNKKRKKFNNIKCGTIILNKDLSKVIMVSNNYNDNDKWGLPKGRRENDETYAKCAKRETREETGLLIDISDRQPKIRINNSYYFPIIYKNSYGTIEPIDKKEIREGKWIEIKNIKNINLNRESRLIFDKKFTEVKQILNLKKKFNS